MLDINGDLAVDLLYQDQNKNTILALADKSQEIQGVFTKQNFFDTYVIPSSQDSNCADPNTTDLFSLPHSNSFIDLTGDCLPDLFITRQTAPPGSSSIQNYFEIYAQQIVNDVQLYCLVKSQTGSIGNPSEMPLIDFADVNRDAMPDLVFYNENKITVLYNQYMAVKPSEAATNLCQAQTATSQLASSKIFANYSDYNGESNDNVLVSTVYTNDAPGSAKLNGIVTASPFVPGRLRMIDINQDGFPDAVFVQSFTSSTGNDYTAAQILINFENENGARDF